MERKTLPDGDETRQSYVKCSPDAHPLPPLYVTPVGVSVNTRVIKMTNK